jgi:hypothetical protein
LKFVVFIDRSFSVKLSVLLWINRLGKKIADCLSVSSEKGRKRGGKGGYIFVITDFDYLKIKTFLIKDFI